jgi:hypothetical protein
MNCINSSGEWLRICTLKTGCSENTDSSPHSLNSSQIERCFAGLGFFCTIKFQTGIGIGIGTGVENNPISISIPISIITRMSTFKDLKPIADQSNQ